MIGWQNPVLKYVEKQWRIYSDSGNVFVLLDQANDQLMGACKGAKEQLEILNNSPF
jgi:hypothetical protein